jgi:hypothetical protein
MVGVLIFLLFFSINVNATTNIYSELTPTIYKVIIITDDLNYKILTDYKYDVYVNNSFLGSYAKDEKIFIPDNSNITIYIPSPIKTDFNDYWALVKSNGIIIISILITFVIMLVIIVKVYKGLTRY